MPKILSYTPKWLVRPSPGFQLFNNEPTPPALGLRDWQTRQDAGNAVNTTYVGPDRTLAHRGTEIFSVAGKHIRWADLSLLKYEYEAPEQTPSRRPKPRFETAQSRKEDEGPEDGSYRVLKIPISEQIRQLSISPNGNLLAIATSQTMHIAILPDSSHLGQTPNKPIKLKTYTIGPTTHVLSQSQVTNIIWHPLGVGANCLVTVTADAVVRLWEFDRNNRWSCDNPALAIDLKKLVVASSEEENFAPDKFGRNRRFSLDNVGLEVASACFGGIGKEDESGWCPMTLWIAMKGGDVYALCPLLPSRWRPSATTIPSISAASLAKAAVQEKDGSVESEEQRQSRDQLDWIRDVDGQEPADTEDQSSPEVYDRPLRPGPVPRLQGPFQVLPEDADDDLEFSDIHVIAAKLDEEEYMDADDSDSETELAENDGLSVSIITLLTRTGRLYICLDLDGVESQWLPRKKPKRLLTPPEDPYLVVFEGLDTLSPNDSLDLQWPTFSQDVGSCYSFFVTHSKATFFFSLDSWISKLEQELKNSEKYGAPLRIGNIKKGPCTSRNPVLSFDHEHGAASFHSVPACLAFQDSDIGYLLLTFANGEPRAVNFDDPVESDHQAAQPDDHNGQSNLPEMEMLSIGPARETYRESESFYIDSSLPRFMEKHVSERHKRLFKDQIRLSTATLDMMTQAHRVLSQETHRVGLAASDLFRRCDRLQLDLREQIKRARDLAQRIDIIAGEDADPYLDNINSPQEPSLEDRLEKAQDRQQKLTDRYDIVKKKFSSVAGRALSDKEQHWVSEVEKAKGLVGTVTDEEPDQEKSEPEFWHRCCGVGKLKEDLIARTKEISEDRDQSNGDSTHMIPHEIRERKIEEVNSLLMRESQLIEGAQARLQQLDAMAVV